MKQISSLELNYLINEFGFLINSRFDKAYQSGKEGLSLQFYTPSKGKRMLKIIVGKAIFLTDIKEEHGAPSGFCMFLRKHLSNSKLKGISQKESERIIELVFEKEDTKKLIMEFFGGGNILLCDKNDIILSALVYHKFRQRSILPRAEYNYPKSKIDIFKLSIDELKKLFKESDRENIVKCLAVELGLGGIYSEEMCLLSGINKLKKPNSLDEKEAKRLFDSIISLKNKKLDPMIIYDKGEIIDIALSDLEFYKNYTKERFDSFSKALEFYFSKFIEKKPSKYEKQLEKLNGIIKEQELMIKKLEEKELDERKRAELIYDKYNLIKEIIEELNKASKKYSWEEVKEKLKNHNIIKEIDSKEKKIVLEIE